MKFTLHISTDSKRNHSQNKSGVKRMKKKQKKNY